MLFSKSEKNTSPGKFCASVVSNTSQISLIFSPIYVPFMKPVCDLFIILGNSGFILFTITFVAILQSTFNKIIGRQFCKKTYLCRI